MQGMWQTAGEETPQLCNVTAAEHNKYSDTSLWAQPSLPVTHLAQTCVTPAVGALRHPWRGWQEGGQPLQEERRARDEGSHRNSDFLRALRWGARPDSVPPEGWSRTCAPSPRRAASTAASRAFWHTPELHWGAAVSEGWGKLKAEVISEMPKYASVLGKWVFSDFEEMSKNIGKSRNAACSENTNTARNVRGSSFANTANNKKMGRSRKSELLSFHWHLTALCFIHIREQNCLKMNVWHSTNRTLKKYHTNPWHRQRTLLTRLP